MTNCMLIANEISVDFGSRYQSHPDKTKMDRNNRKQTNYLFLKIM